MRIDECGGNAERGITDYGEPQVIGDTRNLDSGTSFVSRVGRNLGSAGPMAFMPRVSTNRMYPGRPATTVRLPHTDPEATEADMRECGSGGEYGTPREVRRPGSSDRPGGSSLGLGMQNVPGLHFEGSADIPVIGKLSNPHVSVTSPFKGAVSHRSFLPRAATSTNFSHNLCALVGDRSKVDINSVYTVEKVHIDVDSFAETLSKKSESALEQFVKDPNSSSACIRFQATLPNLRHTPVEHQTVEYRAAPEVTASVEACAVAVIGDDNKAIVEADYGAPTGELDLALLLRNDKSVAKAFAFALANRDDPSAQDSFDRQIASAITPALLGSFLDGTDFETGETKIRHYGGRIRERGAIAATVGEGNTTRSHITVRAHKVEKLDETALDNLADKCAPFGTVQSTIGTPNTPPVRPPAWPSTGASEALEAQRRRRRLEETLEEVRQVAVREAMRHADEIREAQRRADEIREEQRQKEEIREELRQKEVLEEVRRAEAFVEKLRRTRPQQGEE